MVTINRLVTRTLRSANRGGSYEMDLSSLEGNYSSDAKRIIDGLEDGSFDYDSFMSELSPARQRLVVKSIIEQLKTIAGDVKRLGRRGVEGSANAPTKTLSDLYNMDDETLEGWLSNNAEDLISKFQQGVFRPLTTVHMFMKEEGKLGEYNEIIFVEEPSELISAMIDKNSSVYDAGHASMIMDILNLRGPTESSGYVNEVDQGVFVAVPPTERERFIRTIISLNDSVNSSNEGITALKEFALAPLSTYLFRFPSRKPREFIQLTVRLFSSRSGEGEGKFRQGTGDLITTSRMWADYTDFVNRETGKNLSMSEVKNEYGENSNMYLRYTQENLMANEGFTELVNEMGYFDALLEFADNKGKNINSARNVSNPDESEFLQVVMYLVRLFNSSFSFNEEEELEPQIEEAKEIILSGLVEGISQVVDQVIQYPNVQYKKVAGYNHPLEYLASLFMVGEENV